MTERITPTGIPRSQTMSHEKYIGGHAELCQEGTGKRLQILFLVDYQGGKNFNARSNAISDGCAKRVKLLRRKFAGVGSAGGHSDSQPGGVADGGSRGGAKRKNIPTLPPLRRSIREHRLSQTAKQTAPVREGTRIRLGNFGGIQKRENSDLQSYA